MMIRFESNHLKSLFDLLKSAGYLLTGPKLQGQNIVLGSLEDPGDLPAGWTAEQDGGYFRLTKQDSKAFFSFTIGAQSWKAWLNPPRLKLWEAVRQGNQFSIKKPALKSPALAFIGVRPCDVAAIHIQDQVFIHDSYTDPHYAARRKRLFIVTVNCSEPGQTCFCASMGTGPVAKEHFDIALTEICTADKHFFLAESGSKRGKKILDRLAADKASEIEIRMAADRFAEAAGKMKRTLDAAGARKLLMQNLEHPHWQEVGDRCLNCANCTMVCPTCFCMTVEDTTDLSGNTAIRERRWDSCFTMDFSYIHGGSIRKSGASRYRQWITHKLGTWQEQFGTPGCVGCGRCITWCPVGIDITAEVKRLQTKVSGTTPKRSAVLETEEADR